MTAILIIIGLILLFKFVLTSNTAANAPQGTSVVNTGSCGSAGDNFTSGNGIVAGVQEPMHCNVARVGIRLPLAPVPIKPIPVHITYPVAPAPITVKAPIVNPRLNTAGPVGVRQINPIPPNYPMQDPFRSFCNYYGGGETFATPGGSCNPNTVFEA